MSTSTKSSLNISNFAQAAFAAMQEVTDDKVQCVQVGACDGKRWDPVYAAIQELHWRALLIEPHPFHFRSLNANYDSLDHVQTLNCAVSENSAQMLLYHVSEASLPKFPRWLQGCSSLHVQRMNASVNTAIAERDIPRDVGDITATFVPVRRLDDILKEANIDRVDVLVIDTEGHELAVMASLPHQSFALQLAIVECNGTDTVREADYLRAMQRYGLRVLRLGDDLWGVSDELLGAQAMTAFAPIFVEHERHPSAPPAVPAETRNADTPAIPQKMGHIWIGPKCPPTSWMQTWQDAHPDWEYQVFDNDFMINRQWKNAPLIAAYIRSGQYAGASDLMRYELLFAQGGFMPEADSSCLMPVDDLLVLPSLYAAFENEVGAPGFVSPFMASRPGHPFLEQIIDDLNRRHTPTTLRAPFRSVGNKYLGRMIARHKPDISVVPSYFFNPRHKRARRYEGEGPIFAEQHWGTTRHRYRDYPIEEAAEVINKLVKWVREVLD